MLQCGDVIARLQAETGAPGVAACVLLDGHLVYQGALGLSDVENGVPMTPRTVIRIASISKTLTATALLRLVNEGKIDLDAPVKQYLPQYPHPGTVRHLASHLSGMRHFKDNQEKKLATRFDSTEESIAWFINDPLEHAPGTKFRYSSLGYAVLGAVVASAAGMPFEQYVEHSVLRPCGLAQTLPESTELIIPRRSRYYSRWTGTLLNSPYVDNTWKLPGDGYLSTAHDLVHFAHALLEHRLLSEETLRGELWAAQKLADGSKTKYGLGWKIFEPEALTAAPLPKEKESSSKQQQQAGNGDGASVVSSGGLADEWIVGHGGDAVGASAFFLVFPERRLAVALVCNQSKVQLLPSIATIARSWLNVLPEASPCNDKSSLQLPSESKKPATMPTVSTSASTRSTESNGKRSKKTS